MDLTVSPSVIGVVRTTYTEPEATPIQSGLNRAEHGTLEAAEPYRDGLDGLEESDDAWLLTWLSDGSRRVEPATCACTRWSATRAMHH